MAPTKPFLAILAVLLLATTALAETNWTTRTTYSGNQFFSEDELNAQLSLPEEFEQLPKERMDFFMRLGASNLEGLYASKGWFHATIVLGISRDTASKETLYAFKIKEGPRYKFGHIEIQVPSWSRQLISTSQIKTIANQDYDQEQLITDLQDIRLLYRKNGYLHANVQHTERLDSTSQQAHITFNIEPGAQVKMGGFHARTKRSGMDEQGLSDTSWLQKLWTIPQGQVVDGKYMSDFRAKLFGTHLFTQVRLEDSLRTDSTSLSEIHLAVTERVPGESIFGAFWEPSYSGFGVSASTVHKNLFGRFHEASLSATIAQNRQEGIIGYANPLFLGASISFIPTAIRFDNRTVLSHEELSVPTDADSIEKRYELANRGELSFGLAKQITSYTFLDVRFVNKNDDKLFKIKIEDGLKFDFTDNSIDPTKGFRTSPSIGNGGGLANASQTAQEWLGVSWPDDPRYWYVEWANALYFPILGTLKGAIAYDYGHFFQSGIEDDARTFYQGGNRSVRGYRFRSIYPSKTVQVDDTTTEEVSGLRPTYHRVSMELRLGGWGKKWLRKMQLVNFYDWGRVTDSDPSYTRGQEASWGLGLRYKFEVLTLRLDYAFQRDFTSITDWEPFSTGRISFDLSQAI